MRKNTLATAVLAGVTGVAGIVSVSNAVHINPDGTGQTLIYPYYSTRDGNNTLISVVNTTEDAKAVKVRFIEGVNSREVRDFNLYLSGFDVWTASIQDDNDGAGSTDGSGARFVTNDNSCTAPRFFDPATGTSDGNLPDAEAFTDFLYTTGPTPDGGPQGLDRTREGYIELIEMGVLDPDPAVTVGLPDGSRFQAASAVTHTAAGGNIDANGDPLPANCGAIQSAWTGEPGDLSPGGEWVDDRPWPGPNPQVGMLPPSGGLFGGGIVINVPGSRAFGYDAVALDNFFVPEMVGGSLFPSVSLHTDPGSTQPSLAQVHPLESDVVLQPGTASPVVVNDDWSASAVCAVGSCPEAVTAALMTNEVNNEYLIDPLVNAHTEWVITHPTKRFHTFPPSLPRPIAPFNRNFPDQTAAPDGTACEEIAVSIFDRNEQDILQDEGGGVDPSPDPGDTPGEGAFLCFETNVVTFDATEDVLAQTYTPILGSGLFINFDPAAAGFKSGWAQVAFNGQSPATGLPSVEVNEMTSPGGTTYRGLPSVGFAVEAANAEAINALFGAAFEHAYSRVIQ